MRAPLIILKLQYILVQFGILADHCPEFSHFNTREREEDAMKKP